MMVSTVVGAMAEGLGYFFLFIFIYFAATKSVKGEEMAVKTKKSLQASL